MIKAERVTRVPPDREATASTEAAQTAQPTVTIRPFEALGNDPQATLLARGLTADLVTDLSKVSGLSLIGVAPLGDAAGAGTPTEAPPIRYVVSGSVQRVDERLRLHVHLTDAQTGQQLWSERFDRPLSGFFATQEELGPKILQILPAKVSEAELRRIAQRHTRNLQAYEYFQRGQSALLVRQRAENQTAREMFRRAIALDAAFARAYAGLALTYAADYRNQWTADGDAALKRAFEMATTAHQINPDIPETYWVLAFVHLERRQHEQALQYLETAARLYPSFADGYALMGGIMTYIGRPAEAVPLLRKAMRLNPQAGHLYFLNLGRAYLALGDLEQARVNLEQALSRNPENLEAHVYMAALYVTAGDKAAAAWKAEEIRALRPGFSSRHWLETYPMTDVAQKKKLVQALGELGF
jgi:TolB-like protein/cytochrome c-type biogenesis protein CcmH/NrfG